MNYPVVIHKDADSDYGVTVPDLPGCFSAGKTLDEALLMAREAIELHLEGLIDGGRIVPEPKGIDAHRHKADYRGGTWAVVTVDTATLRVNAKRINITMPERVLDAVDDYARRTGDTRSGLLTRAASQFIGRSAKTVPVVKRGRRPKRPIKTERTKA
jgi:predicted RNase H-like HicB family nuclease